MSENRGKIPCGIYFRAIDCNAWIDVVMACELAQPTELHGDKFEKGDYLILHGANPKYGYDRDVFRKRYRPVGSWAGFDAGAYNWEGPCDD